MEKIDEIKWSRRSSLDLRYIFDFNAKLKDEERAIKLVDSIIDTVEKSLIDKLDVAAKDQQFYHKGNYKKLLIGDYKVTFRSEKRTAYVIRVFDMRQNPVKNE